MPKFEEGTTTEKKENLENGSENNIESPEAIAEQVDSSSEEAITEGQDFLSQAAESAEPEEVEGGSGLLARAQKALNGVSDRIRDLASSTKEATFGKDMEDEGSQEPPIINIDQLSPKKQKEIRESMRRRDAEERANEEEETRIYREKKMAKRAAVVQEELKGTRVDSYIDDEELMRRAEEDFSEHDISEEVARVFGSEKAIALELDGSGFDLTELIKNEREDLIEGWREVTGGGNNYDDVGQFVIDFSRKKAIYGDEVLEGLPVESFKKVIVRALEDMALMPSESQRFDEVVAASADILDAQQMEKLLKTVPEIQDRIDEDIQREVSIQRALELDEWDGDPELKPNSNGMNLLRFAGNYAKAFGIDSALSGLSNQAIKAIENYVKEEAEEVKENNSGPLLLLRAKNLLKNIQR